ncbi:MAG: hypothetical protein DRO18_05360 [Thermoprotei archaeon]|nr:MAG: hypothetical protein DRO18_05360 [Thermoprotei archaeon]
MVGKYLISLIIISAIIVSSVAMVPVLAGGHSKSLIILKKLPVKVPEEYPEGSFFVDKFWKHYDVVGLKDITAKAFLDKGNEKGLILKLSKPYEGEIFYGLIPPNAEVDIPLYRRASKIVNGTALIEIYRFARTSWQGYPAMDLYGWSGMKTYKGTIYYKMVLHIDGKEYIYKGRVSFKRLEDGTFIKIITITEGPIVANITSDDPTAVVIAWETDRPSKGRVVIEGVGSFTDGVISERHEVLIRGLRPNTTYKYYVVAEDPETGETIKSRTYWFKTAPPKGARFKFRWAITNDGRAGEGGGEYDVCGVNAVTNLKIFTHALANNVSFIVYPGDLVMGYTKSVEDYVMQLKSWKHIVEPVNHYIPVYVGMGNHEFLVNAWDDGSFFGILLDKWPYDVESSEAIFAKEFVNPTNGPASEDGEYYDPDPTTINFPPYKETVYAFQYGNILIVVVNTDYWGAIETQVSKYGGNIMGYIMDKQLKWLKEILDKAEEDPTIDWVFVAGHTPAFPAGGHVVDSMWYKGNNTFRPYVYSFEKDTLTPLSKGIIERRNEFWEILSNHSKVLAYFSGHEHNYYRILITDKVPVGVPEVDDVDGDGVLEKYSPNPKFKYPVWQINVGTAGAGYYSRRVDEYVPWRDYVEYFTVIPGYALIEVNGKHVVLKYYSVNGELLDVVDLTSVRGITPPKPKPKVITVTETVTRTETLTQTVTTTSIVTTTKELRITETKTVTKEKTLTTTSTVTYTTTHTSVFTTTTTEKVKITAWDITAVVGVLAFVIGALIAYFIARKPAAKAETK